MPLSDHPAALEGLRIVDLAGRVSTAYAGKLFADYGAEVINVEGADGAPTRRLPPFTPATRRSALHGYLSAGKLSVSADSVERALSGADLVLLADDIAGVRLPDRVSTCTLSWFGRSGPYAGYQGSDAAVHALNGMLRNIGRIEGPPLIPSGYQAQVIAGLTAYIGAMGHLLAGSAGAPRTPFHLDVSILEANLCFTEVGAVAYFNTRQSGTRLGINRFPPTYPLGVFPCRDGWIGVTVLTPSQWRAFCRILHLEHWLENPEYNSTLNRLRDIELLEPLIRERLLEHSAEDLFYAGQRARVPLARVPTMAELFDIDQFLERRTFAEVKDGPHRYMAPVAPFRLHGTPPRMGGTSADIGVDDARLEARVSQPVAAPPESLEAPLAGIRVIDLSMGWAGPLAGRHLADLGADVIKVESCERFDWWRSWEATPEWIADNGAEKALPYLTMNRNKRAITLDLEDSQGRELLLQLVAKADVLIENYSGGVLPKLALDYPQLLAVNPEIIMVSMPAFGASGPWRDFRAYGSTVEQASGLPHLNGLADDPPAMQHVAYGDAVGGLNGAAAVLTALRHRQRTGKGQFVDLSQVECLLPLAVHGVLHQSATGAAPVRCGNDHADYAPYGVFPCQGEDEWILIQVFTETDWQALKREAGLEFGDLTDRLARRTELNAALADWTRNQDARVLMDNLQQRGVTAARAQSAGDLLEDPQLCARGFWQMRERVHVGTQPQPSAPYRVGDAPLHIRTTAPTMGQHNADILQGVLGLDDATLAELTRRGVIGDRPRMPSA